MENAIYQLKIGKAFDQIDKANLCYKHFIRAYKIMDSLVQLRKESNFDYTPILAPFYFKLGDSVSNFVELNTDEFGNIKALDFSDSEQDESEEEDPTDHREEVKNDEPVITEQINTMVTSSIAKGNESGDENEKETAGEDLV